MWGPDSFDGPERCRTKVAGREVMVARGTQNEAPSLVVWYPPVSMSPSCRSEARGPRIETSSRPSRSRAGPTPRNDRAVPHADKGDALRAQIPDTLLEFEPSKRKGAVHGHARVNQHPMTATGHAPACGCSGLGAARSPRSRQP